MKYYTPKIEEFRIGFKYESCFTSVSLVEGDFKKDNLFTKKKLVKNWTKMIYNDTHFNLIKEKIKLKEIRVKYLDKSDIEDCGWKNYQCPYTGDKENFFEITKKGYPCRFTLHRHLNRITVRKECYEGLKTHFGGLNCIFKGVIKNYSQLELLTKTIIEELNIKKC